MSLFLSFLLSVPPPPRSTLFPYTTLFRSVLLIAAFVERNGICDREGDRHSGACAARGQKPILAGLPHAHARHADAVRSEEHTSELQSHSDLVCRLLLEKKKQIAGRRQQRS